MLRLDRESLGGPSRVVREEPSGASLGATRFGWAAMRRAHTWLAGMAAIGPLMLLSFLGVDCSPGADIHDAGEPSGSYQVECPQPVYCTPKDPVAVVSNEATCVELGIVKGQRCHVGEPPCLGAPRIVERDAATIPACELAAGHLLCLPGFEDKGCPASSPPRSPPPLEKSAFSPLSAIAPTPRATASPHGGHHH